MTQKTSINGDNGSNALVGTDAADVIYGFAPHAAGASISAAQVAAGFNMPTAVVAAPDDPDHLFVVESKGLVKTVDLATGQVLSTPFLDLSPEVLATGEQGLLGFAFDPDYAANGYFYVYMSTKTTDGTVGGDVEIRRYTRSADNPLAVDPGSRHLIKTIDFPDNTTEHRGGWIGFGPDGYLYAAVGDGRKTPQTLKHPLGKILRLDVHHDDYPDDPGRNYAVPLDNPSAIDGIAGDATGTGIYAAGFRNPWKASFDPVTGAFYIADVGTNKYEEINLGRAGANYGWSQTEGAFDPAAYPDYTNPVYTFAHGTGSYVVGGYVYRGQEDAFHGQYFFADGGRSTVWTMDTDQNAWSVSDVTADIKDNYSRFGIPGAFGEDALGNLYVATFRGDLIRLSPQSVSVDQADVIDAGGGDDIVYAGAGDDKVLGGAGDDVLNGMAGNDTLDGGSGSDRMLGGLGDDSYVVDDAKDVVIEKAGEGKDTIRTKVSYELKDTMSVEVLWTTNTSGTASIDLTGNDRDNQISGNAGVNVLSGRGGADLIRGNAGDDVIAGGSGNDDLRGEAGNDRLDGGTGDDRLVGGSGLDHLAGGAGADTFVWLSITDTSPFADQADVVLDFDGSEGDILNLLSVDAREDRDGAQAFRFIGTADFTQSGQVRYAIEGDETVVYLNTDADSEAEGVIRLAGIHVLQADWFRL